LGPSHKDYTDVLQDVGLEIQQLHHQREHLESELVELTAGKDTIKTIPTEKARLQELLVNKMELADQSMPVLLMSWTRSPFLTIANGIIIGNVLPFSVKTWKCVKC
jgi:hypothetical protein